LLLLLVCTAVSAGVSARELGTGHLPVKIDATTPIALGPDEEIRLEGVVEAAGNVVVVLRVDDMQSWSYATRFNGERTLPPGPFSWTVGALGLRTASGRFLDPSALRRVLLFQAKGNGTVRITKFETGPAPRLPAGARGYSLGPREAELPPGFERIAPGDERIKGDKVFAVHRPAPDPLIASGVRGIERLDLPWPEGRARVTLWTEDPGAWELLPHPLQRRIRVNGVDALRESRTPAEWIGERYLAGHAVEHGARDDAWTAYGSRRGGAVSVEVDVGAGGIRVDLAGSGAEALFLAAVLVEPAGQRAARDFVEQARASWYRATWPVAAAASVARPEPARVTLAAGGGVSTALRGAAAPGTGVRLTLAVTSASTIDRPQVTLTPLALGDAALVGKVWAAQRRLERRRAGDTVLTLGDNMLAGDNARLPLRAGEPRTYELWIQVPETAEPGRYRGSLVFAGEGAAEHRVAVEIDVLPVRLPPLAKPAGFYLDEAPHLTWFAANAADRLRQAGCDLRLMAELGLAGTAPPLATPRDAAGRFEADMAAAAEANVAAPWLAYAPAKRLLAERGIERSAQAIGRLERELTAAGMKPPVWSVADEPSNPDNLETRLRAWIEAIRAAAPAARLAGHLNTPADRRLLGLFDVALVNDGYGLDAASVAEAAANGREAWLYNTGHMRATAGLWLWATAARRYVQWHARMPTADAFDPTDGREGDVQMLFPQATVCPAVPAIHRDLLEMAEGAVDQRWLIWLEGQKTAAAAALLGRIRTDLAGSWGKASGLGPAGLHGMRESIIELAIGQQRRS
jgi:hypothetical protein